MIFGGRPPGSAPRMRAGSARANSPRSQDQLVDEPGSGRALPSPLASAAILDSVADLRGLLRRDLPMDGSIRRRVTPTSPRLASVL